MTLHPQRPADRARTRGRVEWTPEDRHQPYALFDDDGTRLSEYDAYLKGVAAAGHGTGWVLAAAGRLLTWQQYHWATDTQGDDPLVGLAAIGAGLPPRLRRRALADLCATVLAYQGHLVRLRRQDVRLLAAVSAHLGPGGTTTGYYPRDPQRPVRYVRPDEGELAGLVRRLAVHHVDAPPPADA